MFILASENLRVALSDLGAAIEAVKVKYDGGWLDVAMSPIEGTTNFAMAGRTVGPCCGRVRGGEIGIDGKTWFLSKNEGDNHIHGGPHGCALQVWEGEQLSPAHVRFTLELPDGLDGYPGNRRMTADYTLEGDALRVAYAAESDAPTWVDMTNHVYWDLSGRFDGAALDQTLEVAARRVVRNGAGHLPERVADAAGCFDFTRPVRLRDALDAGRDDDQIALGRGFNNAFIFDPDMVDARGFAARLRSPATGLTLTLATDQPAAVLYTGGFLGDQTVLPTGPASPGCAVAIEAQGAPDPFRLGIDPGILRPGETWRRWIAWRIMCKK